MGIRTRKQIPVKISIETIDRSLVKLSKEMNYRINAFDRNSIELHFMSNELPDVDFTVELDKYEALALADSLESMAEEIEGLYNNDNQNLQMEEVDIEEELGIEFI